MIFFSKNNCTARVQFKVWLKTYEIYFKIIDTPQLFFVKSLNKHWFNGGVLSSINLHEM